MNIIEKLPTFVHYNDTCYTLNIYPNAWGNLTISYRNLANKEDYICSVCVEPKNKIRYIEDTINDCFNERIGNAPTFDKAAKMILNYIEKTLNIKKDDNFE